MEIEPIAHIRTNFDEKFGIPRQSNLVDSVGKIVFEKRYRDPEALRGIEGFSHLWLISPRIIEKVGRRLYVPQDWVGT